jgi:hypothetical protein
MIVIVIIVILGGIVGLVESVKLFDKDGDLWSVLLIWIYILIIIGGFFSIVFFIGLNF